MGRSKGIGSLLGDCVSYKHQKLHKVSLARMPIQELKNGTHRHVNVDGGSLTRSQNYRQPREAETTGDEESSPEKGHSLTTHTK